MSKKIGWGISGVIVLIILSFSLELGGVHWYGFMKGQKMSVVREAFEHAKPYVHGVIMDLGKYFNEYSEGTTEEKERIASVVQMRFSEFDANNIESPKLKQWFINMRGF